MSKRIKANYNERTPYKEIKEVREMYQNDEIGIATLITRLKELGCSSEYIQLTIVKSLKSVVDEL